MNEERFDLLVKVVRYIRKDPSFLVDIIRYYQHGVRLDKQDQEKTISDLGFLAGFLFQMNKKTVKKYLPNLRDMLVTLKEFFHTAQIEKDIEEVLNESKD